MTEPADAAALVDAALRHAETGDVGEALRLAEEGARHCLDVAERLGGAGRVEPGLLASLGIALRLEYAYGGRLANLEDAVEALRAGAAVVTDRRRRAALLSELGGALLMWFRLGGDPATLTEAVDTLRGALAELPADSPQRTQVLSNLAAALSAAHENSGAEADLEEALAVLRQAIDAAPADAPNAEALANLGALLLTWASYRNDVASTDEAIEALTRAAARMPADRPQRARVLANLAAAHRLRHDRAGTTEDLDRAVVLAREALAGTAPDAPEYATVAAGLDAVLRRREELFGHRPSENARDHTEARVEQPPTAIDDPDHEPSTDPAAPENRTPAPAVDVLLGTADATLAAALAAGLARGGLTVQVAKSGADLCASLDSARTVVVDHTYLTPGEEATVRERRDAHPGAALIILTSGLPDDRFGADDYVAKPVDLGELRARIRAVSRRSAPEAAAGNDRVLRFGDVELDPGRHEVRVGGRPVPLSRKEFALLALLARRPGGVLTREQLLAEVWGAPVGARSLDVHVATLRTKLGRPQLIQTVRGVGYRLATDPPA
ncbi:response regulator transcription factor [Amycolatopsis sp. NEAU-NG30]|uniref:Sensory transduction protein RegX3 n=1 Tax=Amycolatopsis melonis TaxID=3156488 RepID=A0ABV0L6M4_9PSEU